MSSLAVSATLVLAQVSSSSSSSSSFSSPFLSPAIFASPTNNKATLTHALAHTHAHTHTHTHTQNKTSLTPFPIARIPPPFSLGSFWLPQTRRQDMFASRFAALAALAVVAIVVFGATSASAASSAFGDDKQCKDYQTCTECLSDGNKYCGWCHQDVVYKNQTIGTKCVDIRDTWKCPSIFDTAGCSQGFQVWTLQSSLLLFLFFCFQFLSFACSLTHTHSHSHSHTLCFASLSQPQNRSATTQLASACRRLQVAASMATTLRAWSTASQHQTRTSATPPPTL